MVMRRLREEEVLRVLEDPKDTVVTRTNRLASYREEQGKYIVVIHEKSKDDKQEVIITAMKVDKRRLARFGFTQV
jgi:hypothetical protein